MIKYCNDLAPKAKQLYYVRSPEMFQALDLTSLERVERLDLVHSATAETLPDLSKIPSKNLEKIKIQTTRCGVFGIQDLAKQLLALNSDHTKIELRVETLYSESLWFK